uniref:Uncharacterized protein n=1 Tax=Arundo donax TaxID=35708 RepID=A0A0A9H4X1_ARUDO
MVDRVPITFTFLNCFLLQVMMLN